MIVTEKDETQPVRVPAGGDGRGGGGGLRHQDHGRDRGRRRSPDPRGAPAEVPPQPPERAGGRDTAGEVSSAWSGDWIRASGGQSHHTGDGGRGG